MWRPGARSIQTVAPTSARTIQKSVLLIRPSDVRHPWPRNMTPCWRAASRHLVDDRRLFAIRARALHAVLRAPFVRVEHGD